MDLRTDELVPRDAEALAALYESYEWWADRDVADVRTALEHTDLAMGARDVETGELVAGARVLTDFVYYAKVYDVIVDEAYRDRGVGRALMDAVRGHEALSDVEIVLLNCREGLVPFYESCGFARNEMEIPTGEHEGERLVQMILDE